MLIGIDASRANVSQKTGTEWYSWHIIRALAPRLAGHTIRLYTREPLEEGLQNLGPHVQPRVLHWRLGFLWSHLRLSWEMLWHRPDVLFVPADTVPIIHPVRTVTTIHDIAFERMPELYSQRSVQRRMGWLRPLVHGLVRLFTLGRYGATELDYHRWSVRHALRASHQIIAVSEFTKQELVQLLGADPTRITVTYQGVIQPEEVAAQAAQAPVDLLEKLKLQQPYFLFNGRLERKKNIISLLAGFSFFRESGGQADLVLLGPRGVGWEEIQSWLDHHPQIQPHIHCFDWQPSSHLWWLMQHALGYIFVSAYEGFGRPPLEAFSCGIPVVAARTTSLPEILDTAAVYVDEKNSTSLAAALNQISTQPEENKVRVQRGQVRVRQFNWSSVAEKTLPILLQP